MKHHPQLATLLAEAGTANFIAYDATLTQTKGHSDTNNCVVRAVSVACDLPMDEVKKDLSRLGGRKYGQGTLTRVWKPYIDKMTTKVWSKAFHDKQGRSLRQVLEMYPKGRFILSMRNHLVALIDGKVIDLGGLDINLTNTVWLRNEGRYYSYKRIDSPVFAIFQSKGA